MDGDEGCRLNLIRVLAPSLDSSKNWFAIPSQLMRDGKKSDFLTSDVTKFFPGEIRELNLSELRTHEGQTLNFAALGPRKGDRAVVASMIGLLAKTLRMKDPSSSKFFKSEEFSELRRHINSSDFSKMAGSKIIGAIFNTPPDTPPEDADSQDKTTEQQQQCQQPEESLKSVNESQIGPRKQIKKTKDITMALLDRVKSILVEDNLGDLLGSSFVCGDDDAKEFVTTTISDAISILAQKSGTKKAFKEILNKELYEAFVDTMKVPDWVQLMVKLSAKMPDNSWQYFLNFLNLGRSKVSKINYLKVIYCLPL